jgi:hypothetical protein
MEVGGFLAKEGYFGSQTHVVPRSTQQFRSVINKLFANIFKYSNQKVGLARALLSKQFAVLRIHATVG